MSNIKRQILYMSCVFAGAALSVSAQDISLPEAMPDDNAAIIEETADKNIADGMQKDESVDDPFSEAFDSMDAAGELVERVSVSNNVADVMPDEHRDGMEQADGSVPKGSSPIVVSQLTNVVTVSFEEARRLAVFNSMEISNLRSARAVIEARRDAVWDIQDPELRFQYGRATEQKTTVYDPVLGDISLPSRSVSLDEQDDALRAAVRFFPPNPWILSQRAAAEDAYLMAADADIAHAEWVVAMQVMELFAEINYYEKDVSMTDSLVKLHADTLENMKMGSGQGASTLQDTMIESRRYLGAIVDRESAIRQYRGARKLLSSMLDVPESQLCLMINENELMSQGPESYDRVTMEDLWMGRSDFKALRWKTKAADCLYKEARVSKIPWMSFIQASYGMSSQNYDPSLSDTEEWRVDAAVNIPLFSWFNDAAKVRMMESEQALTLEAQTIKQSYISLQNALEDYKNAKTQWERYETETIPVVKRMEQLLEAVQDSADFSAYERTRIREQLVETQRLKLKADFEMQQAVIKISSLLGPVTQSSVVRDQ